MITYAKHQPTGCDPKGAFLDERQDWFVAPVCRTRDSGPLDEANFEACLKQLGGEGPDVEVHRFGHWGPGWYEIILINPINTVFVEIGELIEAGLRDYPVIDETALSEKETECEEENWDNYGRQDFMKRFPEELLDLIECVSIDERELWRCQNGTAETAYDDGGTVFKADIPCVRGETDEEAEQNRADTEELKNRFYLMKPQVKILKAEHPQIDAMKQWQEGLKLFVEDLKDVLCGWSTERASDNLIIEAFKKATP